MYATVHIYNGARPRFCAGEGLVERPPEQNYYCNVIVLLLHNLMQLQGLAHPWRMSWRRSDHCNIMIIYHYMLMRPQGHAFPCFCTEEELEEKRPPEYIYSNCVLTYDYL